MKIRTQIKAGKKAMAPGTDVNHNQTLTRSLKVRTQVRAGKKAMAPGTDPNHNETIIRSRGLAVKTQVKAGRYKKLY